MVCLGINHFAILPNGSLTEVYNGITFVVIFITTETEQTGTSDFIDRNIAVNDIVARNVDDKLFWLVSVVGNVLNVQYLLGSATAYYRTIVEVNGKTLGVVGAGHIGKNVIKIAQALDIVKKWLAQGRELDKDYLAKDLGNYIKTLEHS